MSKLKVLELGLLMPDGIKITQSAGSVMHGVLMEHVDPDYAEAMHRQALRPYSQYIHYDKEQQMSVWRITALNQQAIDEVLLPAYSLSDEIYLKSKNLTLNIVYKNYIQNSSYEELAEKYFTAAEIFKGVEFNFLTSVSFKSNGEYLIFPQTAVLFNSLIKRWNMFCDNNRLDENYLSAHLAQQVYVSSYSLRLNPFSVEGIFIPACRGKYALGFKGNLMVSKLICMLSEYAEYSGIGIKTALGMGAAKSKTLIKDRMNNGKGR